MIEDIAPWVSWVRYSAFTLYPYQMLLKNEFDGKTFKCDTTSEFDVCASREYITSDVVLDHYGVHLEPATCVISLLAFGGVMMAIALVGLRATTDKMRLTYQEPPMTLLATEDNHSASYKSHSQGCDSIEI